MPYFASFSVIPVDFISPFNNTFLTMKSFLLHLVTILLPIGLPAQGLECIHPDIGHAVSSADSAVTLRLVAKRQSYGASDTIYERYINSPKSVNVHPDGKKYYVNSLEGGTTVVFETGTNRRLAVIRHTFDSSTDHLWADTTALYPFTHYRRSNHFMGKPVESTFSHGGHYLWVPYYRRSFDINAQDPSAVAIIDTQADTIVRMMDCGPLPKMVATSPDGHYIVIAHWGNNTVALIDISSDDPREWRHEACLVVDRVLPLHYPLNRSVDRDNGSGYALRGTAFTPDGRYLLIGCMGGGGGIAVIDMKTRKYRGRILGMMPNVRHLLVKGEYLYLSINGAGYVQRTSLPELVRTIEGMQGRTAQHTTWENCRVGRGARTIVASPSGRYIFVACNNVSRLCVVDTRTMKMVAEILADSYPVGLDISADGRYVYTTSQGRSRRGGNAVDVFEVIYAEPEPSDSSVTPQPYSSTLSRAGDPPATSPRDPVPVDQVSTTSYWVWGAGTGLALLCAGAVWRYKVKGRR